MKISVIIAAAGLGERYRCAGGAQPKLLHRLPDGEALFQATLNNALQSGFEVTVVTRPEYQFIQPHSATPVDIVRFASAGLGETIAAGVSHCADSDGWLIMLADMPWVSPLILQRTAAALSRHLAVRPVFQGQPGHPVGFHHQLRERLQALRGDDGAKSILLDYPAQLIAVDDAAVIQDIDFPENLR
ncbi:hypothetical protein BTJ39_06465 [Izhakiella australiensis]|uniref:MobA-like NTP transferase domain-containing protein n=1 Tax=Izhakiella australiensis TaxID=1926881 RepID=A0A1S8YQ02_9GAMM|nr:nucleotidyltransferase family protein [Izhakiella australiensis]OON40968.1 hypothetical protein BTJ39_06465 [Izhakiella australiensis]